MSIKVPQNTKENYVEALYDAAKEIIWRAEEIVGDIEGKQNISITINLKPAEIVTIDVLTTYLSGYSRHDSYIKKEAN